MTLWFGVAALLGVGLWIRWGNKRLRAGKQPPERSRAFGAVLLVAFCVVGYMWLRATGQIG